MIDPYVDEERLPFVIGEIGINHNGSIELAKKLIDMAKDCGTDAVKFQKRTIDIVYSQDSLSTPRESPWGNTTRDQKEGLEFNKSQYDEIDAYCKKVGIHWFASAWDLESQTFLKQYDLPFNKIASPMLPHIELLEMVADEGKHTFISTGMSKFEQVDKAVEIFKNKKCPFTIMHSVSIYPCPDKYCNIKMIEVIKEKYNCPVGYSGHDVGVLPSVLSVVLGAKAVEHHITLDRAMYGSDQASSLEKRGFELMIRDSRLVKKIIGDGKKIILSEEDKNRQKLRYFND